MKSGGDGNDEGHFIRQRLSVRIVTAEYEMLPPEPTLDYTSSDLFKGKQVLSVPVIRVFGATADGRKCCTHVHGVLPYLCVPFDGRGASAHAQSLQLAAGLDRCLALCCPPGRARDAPHVHRVTVVAGTPFYGYHEKKHLFFKIFLYNPRMVAKATELLQSGVVLHRSFQPHEAHIPYILQFFIDFNLHGMNMLHLDTYAVRQSADDVSGDSAPEGSLQSVSTCELEVDVRAEHISNRMETTAGGAGSDAGCSANPGLADIWREERARRGRVGDGRSSLPTPEPPSDQTRGHQLPPLASEAALLAQLALRLSQLSQISDPDESGVSLLDASLPVECSPQDESIHPTADWLCLSRSSALDLTVTVDGDAVGAADRAVDASAGSTGLDIDEQLLSPHLSQQGLATGSQQLTPHDTSLEAALLSLLAPSGKDAADLRNEELRQEDVDEELEMSQLVWSHPDDVEKHSEGSRLLHSAGVSPVGDDASPDMVFSALDIGIPSASNRSSEFLSFDGACDEPTPAESSKSNLSSGSSEDPLATTSGAHLSSDPVSPSLSSPLPSRTTAISVRSEKPDELQCRSSKRVLSFTRKGGLACSATDRSDVKPPVEGVIGTHSALAGATNSAKSDDRCEVVRSPCTLDNAPVSISAVGNTQGNDVSLMDLALIDSLCDRVRNKCPMSVSDDSVSLCSSAPSVVTLEHSGTRRSPRRKSSNPTTPNKCRASANIAQRMKKRVSCSTAELTLVSRELGNPVVLISAAERRLADDSTAVIPSNLKYVPLQLKDGFYISSKLLPTSVNDLYIPLSALSDAKLMRLRAVVRLQPLNKDGTASCKSRVNRRSFHLTVSDSSSSEDGESSDESNDQRLNKDSRVKQTAMGKYGGRSVSIKLPFSKPMHQRRPSWVGGTFTRHKKVKVKVTPLRKQLHEPKKVAFVSEPQNDQVQDGLLRLNKFALVWDGHNFITEENKTCDKSALSSPVETQDINEPVSSDDECEFLSDTIRTKFSGLLYDRSLPVKRRKWMAEGFWRGSDLVPLGYPLPIVPDGVWSHITGMSYREVEPVPQYRIPSLLANGVTTSPQRTSTPGAPRDPDSQIARLSSSVGWMGSYQDVSFAYVTLAKVSVVRSRRVLNIERQTPGKKTKSKSSVSPDATNMPTLKSNTEEANEYTAPYEYIDLDKDSVDSLSPTLSNSADKQRPPSVSSGEEYSPVPGEVSSSELSDEEAEGMHDVLDLVSSDDDVSKGRNGSSLLTTTTQPSLDRDGITVSSRPAQPYRFKVIKPKLPLDRDSSVQFLEDRGPCETGGLPSAVKRSDIVDVPVGKSRVKAVQVSRPTVIDPSTPSSSASSSLYVAARLVGPSFTSLKPLPGSLRDIQVQHEKSMESTAASMSNVQRLPLSSGVFKITTIPVSRITRPSVKSTDKKNGNPGSSSYPRCPTGSIIVRPPVRLSVAPPVRQATPLQSASSVRPSVRGTQPISTTSGMLSPAILGKIVETERDLTRATGSKPLLADIITAAKTSCLPHHHRRSVVRPLSSGRGAARLPSLDGSQFPDCFGRTVPDDINTPSRTPSRGGVKRAGSSHARPAGSTSKSVRVGHLAAGSGSSTVRFYVSPTSSSNAPPSVTKKMTTVYYKLDDSGSLVPVDGPDTGWYVPKSTTAGSSSKSASRVPQSTSPDIIELSPSPPPPSVRQRDAATCRQTPPDYRRLMRFRSCASGETPVASVDSLTSMAYLSDVSDGGTDHLPAVISSLHSKCQSATNGTDRRTPSPHLFWISSPASTDVSDQEEPVSTVETEKVSESPLGKSGGSATAPSDDLSTPAPVRSLANDDPVECCSSPFIADAAPSKRQSDPSSPERSSNDASPYCDIFPARSDDDDPLNLNNPSGSSAEVATWPAIRIVAPLSPTPSALTQPLDFLSPSSKPRKVARKRTGGSLLSSRKLPCSGIVAAKRASTPGNSGASIKSDAETMNKGLCVSSPSLSGRSAGDSVVGGDVVGSDSATVCSPPSSQKKTVIVLEEGDKRAGASALRRARIVRDRPTPAPPAVVPRPRLESVVPEGVGLAGLLRPPDRTSPPAVKRPRMSVARKSTTHRKRTPTSASASSGTPTFPRISASIDDRTDSPSMPLQIGSVHSVSASDYFDSINSTGKVFEVVDVDDDDDIMVLEEVMTISDNDEVVGSGGSSTVVTGSNKSVGPTSAKSDSSNNSPGENRGTTQNVDSEQFGTRPSSVNPLVESGCSQMPGKGSAAKECTGSSVAASVNAPANTVTSVSERQQVSLDIKMADQRPYSDRNQLDIRSSSRGTTRLVNDNTETESTTNTTNDGVLDNTDHLAGGDKNAHDAPVVFRGVSNNEGSMVSASAGQKDNSEPGRRAVASGSGTSSSSSGGNGPRGGPASLAASSVGVEDPDRVNTMLPDVVPSVEHTALFSSLSSAPETMAHSSHAPSGSGDDRVSQRRLPSAVVPSESSSTARTGGNSTRISMANVVPRSRKGGESSLVFGPEFQAEDDANNAAGPGRRRSGDEGGASCSSGTEAALCQMDGSSDENAFLSDTVGPRADKGSSDRSGMSVSGQNKTGEFSGVVSVHLDDTVMREEDLTQFCNSTVVSDISGLESSSGEASVPRPPCVRSPPVDRRNYFLLPQPPSPVTVSASSPPDRLQDPDSCSSFRSCGLRHWRAVSVASNGSEIDSDNMPLVLSALEGPEAAAHYWSSRRRTITPLQLPPSPQQVAGWVADRRSRGKRLLQSSGSENSDDDEDPSATSDGTLQGRTEEEGADCAAAVSQPAVVMTDSYDRVVTVINTPLSRKRYSKMQRRVSFQPVEVNSDSSRKLASESPTTSRQIACKAGERSANQSAVTTPLLGSQESAGSIELASSAEDTPLNPARSPSWTCSTPHSTGSAAGQTLLRSESVLESPIDPTLVDSPSCRLVAADDSVNQYGFRIGSQSPEELHGTHQYQHLTCMSLEVHTLTRGDLNPDPEEDPISAVFYNITNDVPNDWKKSQSVTGCVLVGGATLLGCSASVSSQWTVRCVDDEAALLDALVDVVRRSDPDILVGWEIERSSWGYVLERAAALKRCVSAALSRLPDQQRPWRRHSEAADGGAPWERAGQIAIAGRVVLNAWRIVKHELALYSYSFENVGYHVLHQRLPRYPHRTLTHWWNAKSDAVRWRVLDYYRVRSVGCTRIMDKLDLVGRTSELARVFGIQFYEVFSRGTQFRVESMMLRLARQRHLVSVSPSIQQRATARAPESLPLILEPESKMYTDPVVVLDFQSLYPSIIIAYNYCFSTCLGRVEQLGQHGAVSFGCTALHVAPSILSRLLADDLIHVAPSGVAFVKRPVRRGVLPDMLDEILNTRIMVKKAMKSAAPGSPLWRQLNFTQLGLKLIANVTYGYTSANFSGRMPCIEVADSVVSKGRETLERAIRTIESRPEWAAKVVYGDTDSLFILLKGRSRADAFRLGAEMVAAVTAENPAPVKLKFEKVYQPCILQTKKRYVGYMYEYVDQRDPVYDAKGIETVRRDGCPAVAKILERSLRVLFDAGGRLEPVRRFVMRQFTKLQQNAVCPTDLMFAREFRGRAGYRPGACVPALRIADRQSRCDRRAEPLPGARVPFLVVYGAPGLPLIQLIRTPAELHADPSLRLNAEYYALRAIAPALRRCFSLVTSPDDDITVAADPAIWWRDIPRTGCHGNADGSVRRPQQLTAMSRFLAALSCCVCGRAASRLICDDCAARPQLTSLRTALMLQRRERAVAHVQQVCAGCMGFHTTSPIMTDCACLECPVLWSGATVERQAKSTVDRLREVLKSL